MDWVIIPVGFIMCCHDYPPSRFDSMDWVIIPVGCIFLSLQMILFLDLGHTWNETWIENALDDQRQDQNQTGRKW